MNDDDPFWQPQAVRCAGDAPEGAVVADDVHRKDRLPPGQSRTRRWPVLDTGVHPPVMGRGEYRLVVDGEVEQPLELTWSDIESFPVVRVLADMHCVTRWSRLGVLWEGIRVADVLGAAGVRTGASFVMATGRDQVAHVREGAVQWTTNLRVDECTGTDCLLAWSHDGRILSNDHGGPLRLVVPARYAWKSAKWLCRLTLRREEEPGYWERGGYHLRGDPWREQRFRFSGSD